MRRLLYLSLAVLVLGVWGWVERHVYEDEAAIIANWLEEIDNTHEFQPPPRGLKGRSN